MQQTEKSPQKSIPQVYVVYEYGKDNLSYEVVDAQKTEDKAVLIALQNPMVRFIELHTLQ